MWEQSIGQSLYMEDSCMLIYKDPDYICGAWMTELGQTGGEIKADIDDYTEEEIVAIFEKYYEWSEKIDNVLKLIFQKYRRKR